jgi:hypothetical protein
MNQSAIRTLCSLLVIAASAAHAESVDSSLPSKAQVVREWSAGIRSNAIRAAKEINREAIKTALTPAALKLEMPMLSDSSELGYPVAMVTRVQAVSPQAD